MKPPKGHKHYNKKFWILMNALYRLKQSNSKWNDKLNGYLIKIGYNRLISESFLYVKFNKGKFLSMLTIYVDDILISWSKKTIKSIKLLIKKQFKIVDIDNVDYIIGIKFIKHKMDIFYINIDI